MNPQERMDFADLVAQAVIDRLEQNRNINTLVESVLARMAVIQYEQSVDTPVPQDAKPLVSGKRQIRGILN